MDPSPMFDDVEQVNTPRVNFFVDQHSYKTRVNVYLKQLRYTGTKLETQCHFLVWWQIKHKIMQRGERLGLSYGNANTAIMGPQLNCSKRKNTFDCSMHGNANMGIGYTQQNLTQK